MSSWVESGVLETDWRPRSGSLLLSVAVHLLALMLLRTTQVVQPDFTAPPLLPVRLIEPQQPKPAPPPRAAPRKEPAAAVKPPPEALPQPEEPAPAPQPPPEEPAPEPPAAKIPLPEQQIVSPSDAGVEKPPDDSRLLSDRDNTVKEQMVRKGAPKPGRDESLESGADLPVASKPSSAQPSGQRTERVASLPNLDQLLPSAVALARQGYGQAEEEAQAEAARQADQESRERRRAAGAWPATSEPIGTLDFLPDIREGDITLLNTKAELFAPFVRRVALRVFQNLIISLRRELSGVGPSAQEQVGAEAVMNSVGDMIGFDIVARSPGISLGIDRKLRQACQDGFFDRNPPPAAKASDGNIHFMLNTQVVAIGDARGYRLGYRVTFQAGLL